MPRWFSTEIFLSPKLTLTIEECLSLQQCEIKHELISWTLQQKSTPTLLKAQGNKAHAYLQLLAWHIAVICHSLNTVLFVQSQVKLILRMQRELSILGNWGFCQTKCDCSALNSTYFKCSSNSWNINLSKINQISAAPKEHVCELSWTVLHYQNKLGHVS